MIDLLEALRDIIATAVAGAECEVARVVVTAGRPSAPSSPNCPAVYVFADQVADRNQTDPNACAVASRFTMAYEIWTCYPVSSRGDETDAQHAVGAECLYELMELVWCALVAAKDSGEPFGACEFVELGLLDVQPRSGGSVSALGVVTVPLSC